MDFDTEETRALIEERGKVHGDFARNAFIAQRLKYIIISAGICGSPNDVTEEAAHFICSKLARFICNPNHEDHMRDVRGYLHLEATCNAYKQGPVNVDQVTSREEANEETFWFVRGLSEYKSLTKEQRHELDHALEELAAIIVL